MSAALAWQNETLVGAYNHHGRHDARWDDAARTGLGFIARVNAKDPARPGDSNDQAWYWLTKAIALGCNDPLVKYERARLSRLDLGLKDAATQMHAAAIELEHSSYPLYRRGLALIGAAGALVNSGNGFSAKEFEPIWRESCYMLDRALTAWAEIAKDTSMPDDVVFDYVNEMGDTWVRASRRDRKIGFDPALAAVKAARAANDPVVPLLNAWFFERYAWDARGGDFAEEVVPSAWPLFYARMNDAEKAVGRAARLGSSDPAIPWLMMKIVGATDGDLDEIDSWFRIGVLADPGERALYEGKLKWLMPKWHGSVEEAEAFAQTAVATDKWGIRVPLLVVDLHDGLSKLVPNWRSYFKLPEVCAELAPVYEEFLKRYPDAGYDRGAYAVRLTYCGRWAEAKRQLDLIAPDRLRVGAFGGQAKYEVMLLAVKAHLK